MMKPMNMKLQYFAEPGDGSNDDNNNSSAADIELLQQSLADLQKNLNNVTAQRDGLLAQQKSAANSSSQSSTSSSSAQPASSTANGQYDALQSQIATLQSQNSQFAAEREANQQRQSFSSKAAKDEISLSSDDLDMIVNSSDQNKAYKYIKSIKANEPKHPNKQFPKDGNNNANKQKQGKNVGKELFEQLNNDKSKDLARFMPGHF